MGGYIGSKAVVTQVDGYNRTEADAEFVQIAGDTMTGDLSVTGSITSTSNVGIGTSSPSGNLDISAGSTPQVILNNTDGTSNNSHDFRIGTFGGSTPYWSSLSLDASSIQFKTYTASRMTIDGGNVGINTTSPQNALHVQDAGSNVAATVKLGDIYHGYVQQNANNLNIISNGDQAYRAGVGTNNGTGNISFQTAQATTGNTESMRIDYAGRVLVNRTSTYFSGQMVVQKDTGGYVFESHRTGTGSEGHTVFINANGAVGTIFTSGTSTYYNTASDYRLKTNAQPMTGASARVQALNPVNFEWIADGTRVDGFLAHEAQEVVPEAVTGTKDAMRDEEYEVTPAVLDDDGAVVTEAVMGTRSVPEYQGIDQAKLVPLLTAALQEALTKIDDMETRLAALEAP